MTDKERILDSVQKLPEGLQAEVLDFIEFLLSRADRAGATDDHLWSRFSLSSAMRGMEDEDTPIYTVSDLKAVFS
jgi:hypothetical protein